MNRIKDVNLSKVHVKDRFWSEKQRLIVDVVIPFQEQILNDEIEGVEKKPCSC